MMPGKPVRQRPDWAGLGWMFLFFWYFSGTTQLLIQLTGTAGFSGLRQSLVVSLFWLIPPLLWPRHTRLLAALSGALLWLCSLPAFGYFLIYGQEFSQSVVFIMFESNPAEASEYLAHYFAWWMVPAFLGYGLGGWLLWRQLRPVALRRPAALLASLLLFGASIGYPAVRQYLKNEDFQEAVDEFEERIEPAVPWQLVVGYHQYRRQLASMEHLLDQNARLPPLQDFRDARAGLPATLVLVIGESTTRSHMGLYGYSRDTTPELDRLAGQLDVFSQVVAPRPYTIEALQEVLTFADQQHPDLYLSRPSLINMMQQAGYRTWWITNQQTMSKRNTLLTSFSQQADGQFYLNNNREQNASQYDEAVLEPFARVLADPAPRKFIVVHLLGTHMRYDYRYPPAFDHFSGRDGVPPNVTDAQLPVYNSYDNAVRYNDHVVSSLIQRFAASQPDGFLLYLSDHGEAVFDPAHPEVLGRNEAAPTAPMYTIPFLLWRSPAWKAHDSRSFARMLARPYGSADLIYTWADLAGLAFADMDYSRSLVSQAYRQRPILIGNPAHHGQLLDFSRLAPADYGPAGKEAPARR